MAPHREEYVGDFRFIEYTPFRVSGEGYGIIALPDSGLVSVIAAGHIIKQLGMEEIGGVDSYSSLPPVLVVSKRKLRTPIRIFGKDNLIVIYSEFMPSLPTIPVLARAVNDYLERKGVKYILMTSGLPVPNRFELEKLKTYYVATSENTEERVKNLNIMPFENGYLVGPYAIILKEAMRTNMESLLLLTEAFFDFPDPEASAQNLEILSKIIGKSVDVKELIEQAEIIRIKARDTMKAAIPNLTEMRKDYEYSTPINI
ncbi:MAG TPA: proteasome assembly chaperone family protein [Thermoprotei archaeon]|nr:proteasome assembly chaperone family protein [Thermoprotei archaeon]